MEDKEIWIPFRQVGEGLGPLQTPTLRSGFLRGPSEPPYGGLFRGYGATLGVSSARRRFRRNKQDTVSVFTPRLFQNLLLEETTKGWLREPRGDLP